MNRQTSSAGSARDLPTLPPRRAGSRLRAGWVVLLGCAGIGVFAAFLWLAEHTSLPPLPVLVVMVLVVVGLVVGPWAYLAARRLEGEAEAGRILRRILAVGAALAGTGVAVAVAIAAAGTGEPGMAGAVAMFSILIAGLLALVGVVVFPWLFLLTRTVTRERAARVRAEERAEVATHLHDSVLQTLTLIQKRPSDPGEMVRLARHAERELRGWLYGPADRGEDDLIVALHAAAGEVEDRFGVSVELVTVGTCRLDERARAVVGAASEALTNAAKHAGVARVSLFAEVGDGQVVVVVRDRGSGFDLAAGGAASGSGGRGIPDSILGRIRRQGGEGTIRTTPGAGTEVELRMPVARA